MCVDSGFVVHRSKAANWKKSCVVGSALFLFICFFIFNGSSDLWSYRAGVLSQETWISLDADGRLIYGRDAKGNSIPDFSSAGYKLGTDPKIVSTRLVKIEPDNAISGGDDTLRIQEAIDHIGSETIEADGLRGVVELQAGTFNIWGTLRIEASGVVLRGVSVSDTRLLIRGKPRVAIRIGGVGTWRRVGPAHRILSNYVPSGAVDIDVENSSDFLANDIVIVQRPFTREWIRQIGMDQIPERGNGKGIVRQWAPSSGLLFARKVVSSRNGSIKIDSALTTAITESDGGVVWKYKFDGRISNVGIEDMSVEGSFDSLPIQDTSKKKSVFAHYEAIEESWTRRLTVSNFSTVFDIRRTASHLTFSDFTIMAFGHKRRRGGQPAAISIDGQNILVRNCRITGSSYIAFATQSAAPGPNVVYMCRASGEHVLAQAHQRWATGFLLDNVDVEGIIHIGNRVNQGTGHGWSGAYSVVWNSASRGYLIESPPGAYNWAFGVIGQVMQRGEPLGIIISPGKRVLPASLYQAQLNDRR